MSKIYLIKEDMANTHTRKCSLSLVMRGIKLKSQQNTTTCLLTTEMKTMALLGIGEDGNAWESQCCVFPRVTCSISHSHTKICIQRHCSSGHATLQTGNNHVSVSTWGNTTRQREGTDCRPWNVRKTFKALCKVQKSQTRRAAYRVIPFTWDSGNDMTTETADEHSLGAGGGKGH